MVRIALKVIAGLAAIWLVAVGALFGVMNLPPGRFCEVMGRVPRMAMPALPFRPLWMQARAGSLRAGDTAPDFLLQRLDKAGSVQLSSLRGRPVVLVFGSYT